MDGVEANSMCDTVIELLDNFECAERLHLFNHDLSNALFKQRSTIYNTQDLRTRPPPP